MCFRNYFCSLKNYISYADTISFLNGCKSGYERYDCNRITIEILPRMDEFIGAEWEEVENYFRSVLVEVNATLPSTHRIAKLTVRKEDFKRTGTLKVSIHTE